MRLFLIPCCKAKEGRAELFAEHRSVVSDLPSTQAESLARLRARVRENLPNAFGGETLSALSLYSGYLYSDATKRLVATPSAETRFLILSGGYGLVRPDELIETYQVNMSESYAVWKEGLPQILNAYLRKHVISSVQAVASRTGRYMDLLRVAQGEGVPVDIRFLRYTRGGAQQAVPFLQAKLLRALVAGEEIQTVDGVEVGRAA